LPSNMRASVKKFPGQHTKRGVRLKSLVQNRLAALSLKSPDTTKLVGICRDEKRPDEERCEATELLGLLAILDQLHARTYPYVVRALLENLRGDRARLVWCAAVSLGYLESPSSVRPILKLARESLNIETRRAAIHALGWLSDPRAVPLLVRVLENRKEPPKLRSEAAEALATCGCKSKRAIAALAQALRDQSTQVRFFSAFALGQCAALGGVAGEQAVSGLRQLLKDNSAHPGFGTVANEAASSLRAIRAARRGGHTRRQSQ